MALEYAQDYVTYDHLIGLKVRSVNYTVIGTVASIDYYTDRYNHRNAVAVLDTGRRICCRRFRGGN
jgi:hypothetical protein